MTGDLLANEMQPWYRTAHCPLGSQAEAPAELTPLSGTEMTKATMGF